MSFMGVVSTLMGDGLNTGRPSVFIATAARSSAGLYVSIIVRVGVVACVVVVCDIFAQLLVDDNSVDRLPEFRRL